jgi:hypothetical protein
MASLGSLAIRPLITKINGKSGQGGSNAQISNDGGCHFGGWLDCNGGNRTDAALAERSRIFETFLHHGAREGSIACGADANAAAPSEPPRKWVPYANGDQWEAVIEGEITFTVKGQQPRVLKVGDSVYIPRGTIHRNENKSDAPARTIELLIMDKDKPQSNPVPTD